MNGRALSRSLPRTSLLRARIAAASGFLLAVAAVASAKSAQVSPTAEHTTVGVGAGMDGAVSPTGGFGASVPLDLPSPRGSVPIPLSIVYTGSGRAGVAGQGWDVPISFVRRSTSIWHRKPYANQPTSSDDAPIGAERVTVSLGGQTHLMRKVGDAWWPARGESFMELRENASANEWSLKTLDNHEYVFRGAHGLWVLTEVRDAIGGDKVVLRYDVPDAPADGDCDVGFALRGLSYTFDGSGTPLYDVELGYEPDWRPVLGPTEGGLLRPCATRGSEAAYPFEHVAEDGFTFDREQLLRTIRVKARNNLFPSLAAKVIRSYHFDYDRDPTTERPRLWHVATTGEEGVAGVTLPVATYGYGALATRPLDGSSPKIVFGQPTPIDRLFLPGASYGDALSTSTDTVSTNIFGISTKTSRLRHVIRDFNGDGLPDLVYKVNGNWWVHPNRLTAGGPKFWNPIPWSGPVEIQEQTTTQYVHDSPEARANAVTTETWFQFVEWNGDGRIDVIDVRGGTDASHWRVWLNRPAPFGGVSWVATQVDIGPLRDHLLAHGFVASDARIPVERARSWTRRDLAACSQTHCLGNNCDAPVECPANPSPLPNEPPVPANHDNEWESDTMTDWSLVDRNGDGYLDIVAGTVPVQHHEEGRWLDWIFHRDPVCETVQDGGYNETITTCRYSRREWIDAIRWEGEDGNPLTDLNPIEFSKRTEFLNRHGAFQGLNESPFSPIGHEVGDARQGVTRWTSALTPHQGPGSAPPSVLVPSSWQTIGYVDEDGDGIATLREVDRFASGVPFPSFEGNQASACEVGTSYVIRQASGDVDLDGDGRVDLVSANWVQFNLGVGYGPPRRIETPTTMPFEISRSVGDCSGGARNEIGLTDLDGDGRPDLLRVVNGQLWMSRIVVQGADPNNGQRLETIDNGYGAVTYARYRNAKQDDPYGHFVPFPEIVVSQTWVDVTDDSSPDLLPTYFAYGGAELVYDPLAASWVFPGYRRRVALRGKSERGGDPNIVGMVEITDLAPIAPAGSSYVDQVASGRVAQVSRFEVSTAANPALFLTWNGSPLHGQTSFVHAGYQFSIDQSGAPPLDWREGLECSDLDPATGALAGTAFCRSAGLVFTKQNESWEGISAPPSLLNVLAGTVVDRVDQWGRPTLVTGKGDLRRTDDDVCTNISYANPNEDPKKPPTPFPSVVSSVVLTDCGWGRPLNGQPGTPQILSASHFRYDNLPLGRVGRGLLTARDIDRYGPSGAFIESHEVEAYTHNALGEVESATSTRHVGTVATQAAWFTYDNWGATTTQVGTQASDVSTTLIATEATSTWPSIASTSTDHSGLRTIVEADAHGRVKREMVQSAGGQKMTRARFDYRDAAPRSVTVETFPGTTLAGSEVSATERTRATTVIDALGRIRYTQSELGGDYGNTTLISGFTVFDMLGRTRFVAAPFEAPINFQPSPTMALPYGTTMKYDPRGRVTREVTAQGINETAVNSSVAGDVFVRQFTYGYEDGLSYTAARGADDNDPSSTRYQAHDDAWSTAIGRQVRRARIGVNGARKDRVDQEWDRLGRVTETRRYLVPSTGVGAVIWRSTFDSVGNRLTLSEPGISTKNFDYDEQGNEIWSWWMDGTMRRGVVSQYDGLGRMTSRILNSLPAGGITIIESHDRMTWDVAVGGADQPTSSLSGRLSAIETVGVGSTYFAYDSYGRTASTSYRYANHNELVREASFYAAGGRLNRIELSTPRIFSGIDYRYDTASRTRRIEVDRQTIFDAQVVSPKGQYRSVVYGNGVREVFDYAPDGPEELRGAATFTSSGTYYSQNVAYDAAGRVTTENHDTPTSSMRRTYTFDDLGRVVRSDQIGGTGAGTEDYTHDPLGNVLTRTATTGTPTRTFTYDPVDPDRLCRAAAPGSVGDCQFTFDGAGNITVDRSITAFGGALYRYFAFDAANRILSARRNTTSVSFTYGPAGRARTVTNGSFPRTVWNFGDLIEDVRPSGTTTVRTTFRVPGPLGIAASLRFENAGSRRDTIYSHGDARGSRFFTDSTGRVIQETVYSLFGRVFSNIAQDAGGLSYTDELWNGGDNFPEVGLSILGARAYDAETGRFLERDPIMNTRRAVTANPYTFAFNDPANLIDPSGMDPPWEDPTPLEPLQPANCIVCGNSGNPAGGGLVDGLPGSKGVAPAGAFTQFRNMVPRRGTWEMVLHRADKANTLNDFISGSTDASFELEAYLDEYCAAVGNSDGAWCADAKMAILRFRLDSIQPIALVEGPVGGGGPVGGKGSGVGTAFRAMRESRGVPEAGQAGRSLGVRPGYDIPIDADGMVHPGTGGMSVSPSPETIHVSRRPVELGGQGKDPVWEIDLDNLGPDLIHRADKPTHGLIEPARSMPFSEFLRKIHETQKSWKK